MLTESIKMTILKAIPDATVFVEDPNQDGEHFEAIVVSPSFEGISLVKQHQLVMKSLKVSFETTVHAFGVKNLYP